MKRALIILATGVAMAAFTSCTQKSNNPFLSEYKTPFGVPPFNEIKPEHYLPAMEEGIKQHEAEIAAIVNNKETPTFANTIEAFEYSGDLLNRVTAVFFNVKEADATPVMDSIAGVAMPMVTKHGDNIWLNAGLFARVKQVYEQRESLNLHNDQLRLVEKIYKGFARGGANLDAAQQARLREINERLSVLELNFEANVRAETNAFQLVLENNADLAGLPASLIAAAAQDAKDRGMDGKWVFTLDKPSIMPFLQYAENRALREKIMTGYLMRGDRNNANDNKANIVEQVSLRAEKAQLLGYPSYAAYVIDEKMAKTPERVNAFLAELWTPSLHLSKKEAADMQAMIKSEGKNFTLASWDWSYYAEKIRKQRYDLNEDELLPYFKLENVLQGAFDVANKLYHITFTPLSNVPVYHPEATVYEVKDDKGALVGILYFDFFPRPTKAVGAWMTEFRTQHRTQKGEDVRPVVSIVCNFTKPVGDKPALLNIDEVETLFHEFGHGLHGLLSQNTYRNISGTNVPTDFVELPSQIMENWAVHPDVLKLYAKHYETGEVIPDALIAKMEKSAKFNKGFETVENIAACMLDMAYHSRTTTAPIADVDKFEKHLLDSIGLIPQIPPRYRSTYFKHPFTGGYTAGYYSYLWSQVLDADAFSAFIETGDVFNQTLAESFRKNVLERGGSEEPMELYKKFRGAEPQPAAMMKRNGMIE